ncbi:MAG: tetratricopeptide repeat protein [Cytophagales bacterium]|nr:MAG: tetratricopeptide repeat protein [Cytophagales bacterium]
MLLRKKIIFYVSFCLLSSLWACDNYLITNQQIPPLPNVSNTFQTTSINFLKEALENDEKNALASYHLARFYHNNDEDSLAIIHLEKALRNDSANFEYQLFYVQILKKQLQYEEALGFALSLYKTFPDDCNVLLELSDIYLQKNQVQESSKYLKLAREYIPQDARIFYLRGNIALQVNDTAVASQYLQKATKIKKNYPEAYWRLAELYSQYEMFNTSLYYTNIGLRYSPKNPQLNFKKAEVFRTLSLIYPQYQDSAAFYYEKTLYYQPKIYQAAFQLGIKYFKENNYVKAQKYFEHTIKYNKEIAEAFYYVGICYSSQNKDEEALKAFERTIALEPNNYAAREYYWNTKSRIELKKWQATNDSLQKIYFEQQKDFIEKVQQEQEKIIQEEKKEAKQEEEKIKKEEEIIKKEDPTKTEETKDEDEIFFLL